MNINEIKKEASKFIEEKEKQKAVSKYIDLLELKKQTEKQLKEINITLKKFEKNPEEFADEPSW